MWIIKEGFKESYRVSLGNCSSHRPNNSPDLDRTA